MFSSFDLNILRSLGYSIMTIIAAESARTSTKRGHQVYMVNRKHIAEINAEEYKCQLELKQYHTWKNSNRTHSLNNKWIGVFQTHSYEFLFWTSQRSDETHP